MRTLIKISILAAKLAIIQQQSAIAKLRGLIGLYKSRTIEIKPYNGNFIFLFVCFAQTFDESIKTILSTSKKNGGYNIVVNNHPEFDKIFICNLVDVYIDNRNIGWDFALYKKGAEYIYKNHSKWNFSKVILANDSVFYMKNGINEFFQKFITTEHDVIGTFENSGTGKYHLSSWFISIEKEIFLDQSVKNFFVGIKEIKNKYYSIHGGEHMLSKVLINSSKNFSVAFSNDFLVEQLAKSNLPYAQISIEFSGNAFSDFTNQKAYEKTGRAWIEWLKINLFNYSPIHTFQKFLLKNSRFPCLKKDLFWNGQVQYNSLSEIHKTVTEISDKTNADAILKYYLKRGRLKDAKLTDKIKSIFGLRA